MTDEPQRQPGSEYGGGDDDSELQELFARLQESKARELSLEFENNELRRSLRKSTSDVALSREYELLCQDRQRMAQLIEQLRQEKEHLIESVVGLSNDVDEAHRTRFDDSIKYKQEVLRHSEEDKNSRRLKYQMGLGIIDILKARGVDLLVLQEVQMHITNSSFVAQPKPPTDASPRVPFVDGPGDGGGDDDRSRTPSSSSRSGRRHRGGSSGRHQHHSRGDRLDRDEDGSDISSVSTHRSSGAGGGAGGGGGGGAGERGGRSGRRGTRERVEAANARVGRDAGGPRGGGPAAAGGCTQS